MWCTFDPFHLDDVLDFEKSLVVHLVVLLVLDLAAHSQLLYYQIWTTATFIKEYRASRNNL